LPQRVELSELAVLAGLSQSHFSRAFKVSTGMAPYQWQLDSRIRRAQLLMLETKSSLEQIADATGFTDAAHLSRIFRRITGTTPAVWHPQNLILPKPKLSQRPASAVFPESRILQEIAGFARAPRF
jgi:transcriptional regulator GlxA family with amidase domain